MKIEKLIEIRDRLKALENSLTKVLEEYDDAMSDQET